MIAVLHLFRWDKSAVAVPPGGNPFGQKYRVGAWICVMCQVLLELAVRFNADHGDDCPGRIEPAPMGACLPGSETWS